MQNPYLWSAIGAGVVLLVGGVAIERAFAAQSERLEALESRLVAVASSEPQPAQVAPALVSTMREIEQRLTSLEQRPERAPVAVAPPSEVSTEPSKSATDPADDRPSATEITEIRDLLGSLTATDFDWGSGGQELQRFIALVRDNPWLDDQIRAGEELVDAEPNSTEARMELASLYIGKLLTGQGPEQAIWGGRAARQWETVRGLDTEHWESRFRLGNNYAFYPDVMGKTDDAIRLLEEARKIQERQPTVSDRAQTYVTLARMYQRKGAHDMVRATLDAGASFYPDDASIAGMRSR